MIRVVPPWGNPILHARRLSRKYRERLSHGRVAMDHLLAAIQTLQSASSTEDPLFLAHGLDLLVGHLGADLACMVSVEGTLFETRWWSPDLGESDPPPPVTAFCRWLTDHPHRVMVLRDIPNDPRLSRLPDLQGREIQAALGAPLWQHGAVKALLFAHFHRPQAFGRAELALLTCVAGFMGRILEVEDLKSSLGRLENALAITKAVMEDSSIQDPATDLPNLRYLDIWLKAHLGGGRHPEPMAVAVFRAPVGKRKDQTRLRLAAEQIRGTDLLVAAGEDRFLALLLGATKGLAHILLMRLRNELEGVAMGATLWIPDQDDPALESARRRAEEALREAQEDPTHPVHWHLPDHLPARPQPKPRPAPSQDPRPAPDAAQPWRPQALGEAQPEDHQAFALTWEPPVVAPARRKGRDR